MNQKLTVLNKSILIKVFGEKNILFTHIKLVVKFYAFVEFKQVVIVNIMYE